MTNFPLRRSLSLVCLPLSSLCMVLSCKTAEFRSTPGEQKLPVPKPSAEITTEQKADPVPERVSPPDAIVETRLNPMLGELNFAPVTRVETFVQEAAKRQADILIVIDDSNSMREEQVNLSTKMWSLLKSLTDVDWRIGVITTSEKKLGEKSQCDLTLVRSEDAGAEAKFAKAVQPGTDGDANEQGILQAVVGLRCTEAPWVREKSTVAVLIVSDEDNCSNGMGCNQSPALSERYLTDYVEKDLGRMVGINAGFYGIYSPPGDECSTAPAPAYIYQRLIDYRMPEQKNFGNICDSSYQMTLERISGHIAELLKNTFELKEVPVMHSVRVEGVKSNGKPITTSDFSVMGKVLGFQVGSEPKKGTTITVSYEVPGTL